jgi:hypothetical protein
VFWRNSVLLAKVEIPFECVWPLYYADLSRWNDNDPARPSDTNSTYSPVEPRDTHESSQNKKRSRSRALAGASPPLDSPVLCMQP